MIPEEPLRPDTDDAMVDLLGSIAMEEIAISHLLSAEAKKMLAFIGKDLDFPTNPSNAEIFQFNKEAARLIESLVIKEWLLLRKLQNAADFFSNKKENHQPLHDFIPPCPEPLEEME
ncbi:hypothetical protein JK635_12340 [Neobacillus sp. YIM B02564]|jgi:hypothetical protein|uniref:Uncharacterized protein n=1 Tax=Neobacillus paridis TaxID=2803862 RepID=A0ABS1TP05_9BACI|nr:hypothetical protein [Neobacillus paridis]MBL4953002.1 hypothetical protein [Neobacillus paridis]